MQNHQHHFKSMDLEVFYTNEPRRICRFVIKDNARSDQVAKGEDGPD